MSKIVSLAEHNGRKFWATPEQTAALEQLAATPRGGIGTVRGYIPSTGYINKPVVDIQGIFRFSTERLYARKVAALKAIKFEDLKEAIADEPKLAALSDADAEALFNLRLQNEIASMEKTISGDRNDSHREAHDLFYVPVTEGVRVHLASTKADSDGLKSLTLVDGYPVAESIMVNYLEIKRTYVVKGERKTVNSGAPVLMSNAIDSLLNNRSVGFRALSLKPENFSSFAIGGTIMESADLVDNKQYRLIADVI